MTTGKIKWFNPAKGYGFIEQEGNKDVFLHVSALEKAGIDTLQEGEEIEFEMGENRGKENAINVPSANTQTAKTTSGVDIFSSVFSVVDSAP